MLRCVRCVRVTCVAFDCKPPLTRSANINMIAYPVNVSCRRYRQYERRRTDDRFERIIKIFINRRWFQKGRLLISLPRHDSARAWLWTRLFDTSEPVRTITYVVRRSTDRTAVGWPVLLIQVIGNRSYNSRLLIGGRRPKAANWASYGALSVVTGSRRGGLGYEPEMSRL